MTASKYTLGESAAIFSFAAPMAAAIFVFFAVIDAWRGYVVATIWGWCVVPLGLPPVTWWQAYGALAIHGIATYRTRKDEDQPPIKNRIISAIMIPTTTLALFWLFRWVGGA